jgi:hypothetical protein
MDEGKFERFLKFRKEKTMGRTMSEEARENIRRGIAAAKARKAAEAEPEEARPAARARGEASPSLREVAGAVAVLRRLAPEDLELVQRWIATGVFGLENSGEE